MFAGLFLYNVFISSYTYIVRTDIRMYYTPIVGHLIHIAEDCWRKIPAVSCRVSCFLQSRRYNLKTNKTKQNKTHISKSRENFLINLNFIYLFKDIFDLDAKTFKCVCLYIDEEKALRIYLSIDDDDDPARKGKQTFSWCLHKHHNPIWSLAVGHIIILKSSSPDGGQFSISGYRRRRRYQETCEMNPSTDASIQSGCYAQI